MEILNAAGQAVVRFFETIYAMLWGDIVTIPLPGGSSLGLSLLVIILVPAGIYLQYVLSSCRFDFFRK